MVEYAGYAFFSLSSVSAEHKAIVNIFKKIEHSVDYPEIVRSLMEENKDKVAKEFKVHLQPQRKFTPLVVSELAKFLTDPEARKLITTFKVLISPESDSNGQQMPEIVIYPNLGRENARELVLRLKQYFAGKERFGKGVTPRFNARVSNLIYLAQSGGDLKNDLSKASLLDEYFDKDSNYGFMNGESVYWRDLVPGNGLKEKTPEENLKRSQEFLGLAMHLNELDQTTPSAEQKKMVDLIRKRLQAGEDMATITRKAAANVRSQYKLVIGSK